MTVSDAGRFLRLLWHHFHADKCLRTAASLSYTTLLSLVPLLVVMFSAVSAFPVFKTVEDRLQDFIFQNFVPAAGEMVQSYIQQFLQQATALTGPGILFLVLVAVMLMDTIDGVLNDIWGIPRQRHWLAQFLVYWAVLTLGPLLLAVSIAVSSYLVSLPLVEGVDPGGTLRGLALSAMPFFSSLVALTLLYVLVPHRSVPLRLGLAGAVVAAVLFELAKRGFTLYVAHVPTYTTIYGALGVIPLFLVWIYVSWVVVLLGAEISHCMAVFRRRPTLAELDGAPARFVLAYRVLGHLREAQRQGGRLTSEILAATEHVDVPVMEEVLADLAAARLIAATQESNRRDGPRKPARESNREGGWLLARHPDEMTLKDLYNAFPCALPAAGAWRERDAWNRRLGAILEEAATCLDRILAVPLGPLYATEGGATDGRDGDGREQDP